MPPHPPFATDDPPAPGHIPIMVEQILDLLAPKPGETYIDLTIGRAGHALAVAPKLSANGSLIAFDLDQSNLTFSKARLKREILDSRRPTLVFHHTNFAAAPDISAQTDQKADLVLADLGFASSQMDDPNRGFAFSSDGPLDMRLDPSARLTAEQVVNQSSEREIADLIFKYGEDPFARKIARTIVADRQNQPIKTTAQLARTVRNAYGSRARQSRMHPATRTFMALRIAVNNELANLEALIHHIADPDLAARWLNPRARIAFLSFHSLEDRIIKYLINDLHRDGRAEKLSRKLIKPGDDEIRKNPRARSAKLRAFRLLEPKHT